MRSVQLIKHAKTIQYSRLYRWVKAFMLRILYPFSSYKIELSLDESMRILNDNRPKPDTTSIHKNVVDINYDSDLTVIIPAYNVADYIDECVQSVLSQETRYNFKVVLVDDGSTDETGRKIDLYKEDKRVSIVHKENGGLSSARNCGLFHLTSKYVTFVDSDDCLPPNAIQRIMDAAYLNDADIVEGSHYRMYDNADVKAVTHSDSNSSPAEELIGMAWGKVYKSSLFENIIFPEKLLFEDSICTFLLYPQAKRIATVSDYVYKYRIILTSITHSQKNQQRSIDTLWITELMLKEHLLLKLPNNKTYFSSIIKQIVLNYKRMKKLPESVQQAAFVVTCDFFKKYCSAYEYTKDEIRLVNALNTLDYGKYKIYCGMK